MNKFLYLPLVLGAGVFMSGCAEPYVSDGYPARHSYDSYDDGGDVDFYYVSSRPYSRSYGQLYYRGDRYYYQRSGRYVVYDRPTVHVRNTRVVNRTRYDNNDSRRYEGQNYRSGQTYHRTEAAVQPVEQHRSGQSYRRTESVTQPVEQQRVTQSRRVTSTAPQASVQATDQGEVKVVDKKKKKKTVVVQP